MKRITLGAFAGLSTCCWLLLAPAVLPALDEPEQQEPSDPPAETEAMVLDEILVTAEKREEDLQLVPIQVAAYTSESLEAAGIETPEDLVGLTSNMLYGNSFTVGNSYVTLRGATQLPNSDPPVAVVVDEVYQANNKQLNQELFDVERVEILKGPQGSIYGRNALGGVINIITKEPTTQFGGFVLGGIAEGNGRQLAGSVNGGLGGDRVLARLAASYKESDGLIRNVFLDRLADPYEDLTGRVRLRMFPSERASVDLRAQTSSTDGGAALYSLLPTDGGANRFDIRPDENILGFSERDVDDFTAVVTWLEDGWSLVSISGYTDLTETYRSDLDFSNQVRFPQSFPLGAGQDLDVSYFSQELRISSADDRDTRWLAGVYYLETDRALDTIPFLDTNGTVEGFIPLFVVGEDNDNTAYAVFGQVDYRPSEKLTLDLGLRYDRDEREQTDPVNGGFRQRSFDDWQPRVTLSYAPRPDLLGYLTLARGFRSGGYNAPPVVPDFFLSEEADMLELGFKSTLGGGRTRLNGAVYLTRVDDFQFFQVDVPTASQIISNIEKVEILGLELDLLTRVARWLDVFAALGLNDSSIEDFDGSGRFIGNQTPNNVRWTGNLGGQLGTPLTESLLLTGRLDVELRGKQYWHSDNLDVTDGRQFVHLRLGIESGEWSATVWAKNLTDEDYWAEYFDATWGGIPSGMDLGHPGPPRSVGGSVRFRF